MKTLIRRNGWGLADHAISAATNFLLLSIVAAHVSASKLGEFALLYGYYVMAVELARAACGEPLLVRLSRQRDIATEIRAATGAAACCGALAAIPLLLAALIHPEALVLAVALPALLVQDAYRMAFIAAGTPVKAVINDAFWAVVQCTASMAVLSFTSDLSAMLAAWSLGGAAAAVLAMLQAGRTTPRPTALRYYLRSYGVLAKPYLIEAAALSAAAYAVLLAVGWVGGLAAAGGLRAAQTLLGPANVVLSAGRLLAIAELSRVAGHLKRLGRAALLVGALLAMVGAMAGLAAVFLPDSIGRHVLGASWPMAAPLLPALALQRTVMGATLGPTAALRALEAVRTLFAFRIGSAIATLTGGVVGAYFAGAWGAATGLAVTATAAWLAALIALRFHRRHLAPAQAVPLPALPPDLVQIEIPESRRSG